MSLLFHPVSFHDADIFAGGQVRFPRRRCYPMACNIAAPKRFRPLSDLFASDFKQTDGGKAYEVAVSGARGFGPGDLRVKVDGARNGVEISAETSKDGVRRFFKQFFTLPEDCKAEDVKAKIGSDGVLRLNVTRGADAIENKTDKAAGDKEKNQTNAEEKKKRKEDTNVEKAAENTATNAANAMETDEIVEVEVTAKKASEDNFRLEMDVAGFSASDLDVELDAKTGSLVLRGKKEETGPDGGVVSRQEFTRSVTVDGARFDLERMEVELEEKVGKLVVSAPRKEKAEEEKRARSIPVQLV